MSTTWSTTAVALVVVDLWIIIANHDVTLYNVILAVFMFRFLVREYLKDMDEASRQLYHSLTLPQYLLLAMVVNEAFNCDTMIAATSPSVPFHGLVELGAAWYFILFTRFFMGCTSKQNRKELQ